MTWGIDTRAKRWKEFWPFAGFALGLLAAIACDASGSGSGIDEALRLVRDGMHTRKASGKVVVVELDARSLAAISTWPWPRRREAQLVDRLNSLNASMIAFDVDFSAHGQDGDDRAFAEALARAHGGVILPTFVQSASSLSKTTTENLPVALLREHSFIGSVNVLPDADGQLRSYSYGIVTGGAPRPSIAALLAGSHGSINESFRIDTAIDPTTIPRVSAIDLLAGRTPRAAIAGRAVVVGATAVELGDRYLVPGHGVLPGVVVQALAAETLIQQTTNPSFGTLPPLVLTAALVFFAQRRKTVWSGRIGLTVAGALLLTAPLIFEIAGIGTVEIVPALAFVSISILWLVGTHIQQKFFENRHIDPITGLPNTRALERNVKIVSGLHLIAARLPQLEELNAVLSPNDRTALTRKIVERILTGFPAAQLFAVESGVIAWAICATSAQEIGEGLEGLCALFRAPLPLESRVVRVSPVFGIAQEDGTSSMRVMLANVLLAARQAQDLGLRWKLHTQNAASATDRGVALLADISYALTDDQIYVVYQPKYDLRSDVICGCEALVRWNHHKLGPIFPDEFIPLLEDGGHIADLTRVVINRAFAEFMEWEAADRQLSLSINISASLLDDEHFTNDLYQRLAALGASVTRVILEVTESAAITGAKAAITVLARYRTLGAKVSIDDYGTGHATMSYLKSFPSDEIKIDKSFITNMLDNVSDQILVRATIELAHELGFRVVAEGVEHQACLDKLREYNCDIIQGWLIGKPMSPDKFLMTTSARWAAIAC